MKQMRRLLGFILLVLVLILVFYGVETLEISEKMKLEKDKLEKIWHQNPDVYAWITVDGTKIDYPIAQHPTDDAYYLSHDLDHHETYYGAIFTETVNTKTFEDLVTIVYGHAMTDDAMFGSLDYFADLNMFEDYQTIKVSTKDKVYTYQIIAAYPYTDDHLFHTFTLGDATHVAAYLSRIPELANQNGGYYRESDIDPSKDKVLILSTCDAVDGDKRFVVHAIKKGENGDGLAKNQ